LRLPGSPRKRLAFARETAGLSTIENALGAAQRILGRSALAARLAVKVRNQCDMVIGSHMTSGNLLGDSGEAWLVGIVAPGATCFVDVGANIGAWSIEFAARMAPHGRGLLFEPNPDTAAELRARTAEWAGLEVFEAAAGQRRGRAAFLAEESFGETSSFYTSTIRLPTTSVEVDVLALDDVLSERGIDKIDMLKIDAEGHDFHVIEGAEACLRQHKIAVLQFEYNRSWVQAGSTLTRAFSFLASLGYTTKLLRRRGLVDFDVDAIGEFFAYSNFVAYCDSEIGERLARSADVKTTR
jgi:FkbM family methyltransferase